MADKSHAWTPYRYGFNNPLKFIDPDGNWEYEARKDDNVDERYESTKQRKRELDLWYDEAKEPLKKPTGGECFCGPGGEKAKGQEKRRHGSFIVHGDKFETAQTRKLIDDGIGDEAILQQKANELGEMGLIAVTGLIPMELILPNALKFFGVSRAIKNFVPEGNVANHLFKGFGKLNDNPANRKLIESISNGKALTVDRHGKAWYRGVDEAGQAIYTYTQNGIVKGAGYTTRTAEELINHIIQTVGKN